MQNLSYDDGDDQRQRSSWHGYRNVTHTPSIFLYFLFLFINSNILNPTSPARQLQLQLQSLLCQAKHVVWTLSLLGDTSEYWLLWWNISIMQLQTHPVSITLHMSPHTVDNSMIPICPHLCPDLHLSAKPRTWTWRSTPRLFTLVTTVLFVFLVWLLLLLYSPIFLLFIVVICI